MQPSTSDVVGLIDGLTLSENTPEGRDGERPNSLRSSLVSLQDTIQELQQSTNTIILQAQSARSLVENACTLPIDEVIALHEQTTKLTDIASNLRTTIDTLIEATEQCVIRKLCSLGNKSANIMFDGPPIQKLLSHFDADIRKIVREVLNNFKDQSILWRVAEKCYEQAISHSGILYADDYFVPLEEAQLEWPYDPDFESEEYYEHENRLDIDDDYAADFRAQVECRSEESRKNKQGWVDFWIHVLNNAPDGPTLFYPPAGLHGRSISLDVPIYLFRTFDTASSGRNDDTVIASMASRVGSQNNSRNDILGIEKQRAAKLLYLHLEESCFGGGNRDNLMSWTSSLLFAIQYAVWRAYKFGCPTSNVKICAIDTRRFPLGQFMRDIPLLNAFYGTAEQLDGPELKFFDSRLSNDDFYNGEYLSQGAINHSNRSCVVSLEQLIQSGLYQLYPEFENPAGRNQRAKRVRDLRQVWSAKQKTTNHEIQLAIKMGSNCFHQLDLFDIASLILTFKNRELSITRLTSNFPPQWADKPSEVNHFWTATQAKKAFNQRPFTGLYDLFPQNPEMLRNIFA